MSPDIDEVADTPTNPPLVSVIVPSYNHARYIEKAINSVLAQEFGRFELLISDDASTDNSWEIISKFDDPRIRSFRQDRNLGPVGNLVFLIRKASGKYVALLNSDDAWYPQKLQKQIEVMVARPELAACFTWADLVDENGRETTGPEAIWNDVFRQQNRSQGQWLRHFFFKGNCLCHPSILIRRDVYDQVGFYNPGLKQLPDFEMWIRLVKRHPIYIVQENLVAHLRDGNNTSAVSPENSARNLTELVEIFRSFFDDVPDNVFIDGFAADLRLKDITPTHERLLCEKLFLLLDSTFAHASGQAAAISLFTKYLSEPDTERVLRDEYRFSVSDFYRITGKAGFGHFVLLESNTAAPRVDIGAGALKAARPVSYLRRLHNRMSRMFK